MNLQNFLSSLKKDVPTNDSSITQQHYERQHQESPHNQLYQSTPTISIPSLHMLEGFNPEVIRKVQQEYLEKQQRASLQDQAPSLDMLLDSLKSATSITSDVLVALGRMAKETNLLQVLRHSKRVQDAKERSLFEERQKVEKRIQQQLEVANIRELTGFDSAAETEALEKKSKEELRRMDERILREMDREMSKQQGKLSELKVPFFKLTRNQTEIRMQAKVLSILQDMMDQV